MSLDWAAEVACDLYLRQADATQIAAALRAAEERGEKVNVKFEGVVEPGLFKTGCVMGFVGYSGDPAKPAVHVQVSCSEDDEINLLHPAIEALMLAWAKDCGEGIERGLDILRENAIHQLTASKL